MAKIPLQVYRQQLEVLLATCAKGVADKDTVISSPSMASTRRGARARSSTGPQQRVSLYAAHAVRIGAKPGDSPDGTSFQLLVCLLWFCFA